MSSHSYRYDGFVVIHAIVKEDTGWSLHYTSQVSVLPQSQWGDSQSVSLFMISFTFSTY